MSKLTQVKLVALDGSQMTTWVDSRPDLQRGRVIELKKTPDKQWMVKEVYATEDEKLIKDGRDFDNNNYDKHEGLKFK